jgi:hypothetical protein
VTRAPVEDAIATVSSDSVSDSPHHGVVSASESHIGDLLDLCSSANEHSPNSRNPSSSPQPSSSSSETDPGRQPPRCWKQGGLGVGDKPAPRYMESFPTIVEGSHRRSKSQSVEFPIDPSARRFTRKSE